MNAFVVAIDGPSGSGKSSVSKALAQRLDWQLLDTGSVYRALTWYALQEGVDLDDADAVIAAVPGFLNVWTLSLTPGERWVRVAETDVTERIRETAISEVVSKVAGIQSVRDAVNTRFREILAESPAEGIIAEGRDITTVVAPDAPVRILLTADEAVRIARRQAEKTGEDAKSVAATVSERDKRDSRVTNFTAAAEGVAVIDSTDLGLEATIQAALDLITSRSAQ
ncbi:(d)CMP kinase [Gulosibacter chungangensis]|uniref:Cytidylate kinase n=1 Tax=Gulosibacter chungangensis TaxID=979746 RepID=A0A7J5BEW3_9MICO|nr:(d)CMP kinase [Gulosibacter chungangensis]KAB1643883.1 (d)CMP kinase [Gulosibacter chungangensis]